MIKELRTNEPRSSGKTQMDPVEMAIIGPFLLGDSDALSKFEELSQIGFNESFFTFRALRQIWKQIALSIDCGAFSAEKIVSYILRSEDFGQERAARSMLIYHVTQYGSAINMTEHAAELMERSMRAELSEEISALHTSNGNTAQLLDELENKISRLRQKTVSSKKDEKLQACEELIDELQRADRGEIVIRKSNVEVWDRGFGGLPDAQLIILAGRPGDSKTSLAEQIIDSLVRRGVPVLYIQRELSRTRALGRIACRKANVPWFKVERRITSKDENTRLIAEIEKYKRLPLFLSPVAICNSNTIAPLVRYHAKTNDIKLVVLDYVQLMNPPRGQERWVAIGELTASLKRVANETGVTVLALAQLGRPKKKDDPVKPQLSDLRESGNIEQDADAVVALWRDDEYENQSRYPIHFSILKQRNGARGSVKYNFDGPTMTFLDEYEESEDPSAHKKYK